jgi:hypothetical protein
MKVGILTFNFALNYGAQIQALALRSFLQSEGHAVNVINYCPYYSKWPWWVGAIRLGLKHFLYAHAFISFRKRFLNETRKISRHEGLNSLCCDAVIVGSDQVWNIIYYRDKKGHFDAHYFLSDLSESTRRISYAASLGEGIWNGYSDEIRAYIQKFYMVSVRERHALKTLESIGIKDVAVVPDPTALLNEEDYTKILGVKKRPHLGYRVFVYGLGEAQRCVDEIMPILQNKSDAFARIVLMRYATIPTGIDVIQIRPSPASWVNEIANSDYVITDSFHCMMMCLIYHRPFKIIYKTLEPHTNDRMKTILDYIGLEDTEHPNWEQVDMRMKEYAQIGKEYLKKALM